MLVAFGFWYIEDMYIWGLGPLWDHGVDFLASLEA